MDQPVIPSMCPSIHQPSSTLKLGTPFKAAFIPLVPEASMDGSGVLSYISTPDVIMAPGSYYSFTRYATLMSCCISCLALKIRLMSSFPLLSRGWAFCRRRLSGYCRLDCIPRHSFHESHQSITQPACQAQSDRLGSPTILEYSPRPHSDSLLKALL